ncbi:MAG TPA: hypothetical protein VMZ53_06050 [Kofleriaceae bacterium]|nr:hypothetical protein [Kofleriaceae bacterium]
MRMRLTLLVLGFAGSAYAAPSAEDELAVSQLELGRRRDVTDELPILVLGMSRDIPEEAKLDPYVRSAAFAQLAGGGEGGGGAAAGAAMAIGGIGCDIAHGSAQGRFRPFAHDEHVTGQVDYGACLSRVAFTIAFDGTRGIGLAPSLSDRRSLWSRRYATAYDQIEFGAGELYNRRNPNARHTILPMIFGHGETTQVDGSESRTIVTLDLDLAAYRYRRVEGLQIDAAVLESNALKAGIDNRGGVASAFYPARVSYDDGVVFVQAAAGWGMSGGSVTQSSETKVNGEVVDSWTETIDSEGLPNMTIFVGRLQGGVRGDRLTTSAAVSRSFYPTFDGNIAREARVSGDVTYVAGRTRRTTLSLAPFATRTHTWTREDGSIVSFPPRDVSAGASLHVGRELTKQLRVDAIGEAGVSPYARLDRERLPSGSVGGQVLVALTGKVTDFTGQLTKVQH